MANIAKIEQLKRKIRDELGRVTGTETVYPVTRSSAVYMSNNYNTVDDVLAELQEVNETIKFNTDGSIVRELDGGGSITTVFGNNVVTETKVDGVGKTEYVRTTTFVSDGTIKISQERPNE